MNSKTKNKKIYLLSAIFVLVMVIGFGWEKNTKASTFTDTTDTTDSSTTNAFTNTTGTTDPATTNAFTNTNTPTDPSTKNAFTNVDPNATQGAGLQSDIAAAAAAKSSSTSTDLCPGMSFWSPIPSILNCIFLVIAKLLVIVVKAIFTLFITIIAPSNITNVVGNSIIYQMWAMVRDVLNVCFIMAILFSAFCTIFQIQKYSYKNMLITIIVMALLVNFSFPIARVIIDISNVLMYSFVQGLGITSGTGGFTGQILTKSGLDTLVSGITSVANASPVFLIALVIFLFIFGMTLLIIAVLFVIRLVALAILIIFSPIAFVGPTLPFLSKYSGEWWDNLFKYCFFGPIMVFMLYVSLKMMTAISSMGGAMQTTAGQTGEAATTKLVGSIAFFSIPIVILWFGMAVAQKMSIAGAGALVDGASKFGKGAGKKLSGYNATKKRYDAYKDERKTRADEKFKKNWGKSLGQKVNNLQDKAQTILPKTKKDRFGSEAAQRRLDMRLKTVNKEAVKNAAEGKEGDGTIDLVSKISTTINMIPDDRAKLSKQDKISKAAEVKQAMSRGKEFEMEVQNRIKTRVAGSEMDKFVNDNKLTGAGKDEIKSAYYAAARKVIDEGEKAK